MAYFLFAQAIVGGKPIKVFDESRMLRDFTYIDDIVEGVVRTLDRPPSAVSNADATHEAPYRVLNIGNNAPVALSTFIETLETKIGKKAERIHLPMQPGDVVATYADTSLLNQLTGFAPSTPLATGLGKFVDWYRSFYSV
jgi:UDP-glucuronate 4-epimerase